MSLTKILLEFGNLEDVYDYQGNNNKYFFNTDDHIEYIVGIWDEGNNVYEVGFDSVGGNYIGMSSSKAKNPYKVFNTIFKIIDDFYEENKNDIDAFLIHADQKRQKIYKYYIKKFYPSAKIEDDGYDPNAFIVKF